jgi:hypothetical protein
MSIQDYSRGMLAAMWLLGSQVGSLAQSRPDLSGIWAREGRTAQMNFSEEAPPMQAWAKAAYDENQGHAAQRGQGIDELDPANYCLPLGMPRSMAYNYPFEVVQTPNVVYILFEAWQMQRRIFLDGRKPKDAAPLTYLGFSTGRYDGDTLLVETTGISDQTWLDNSGIPHTDALKVTERIRRTGPEKMENALRFEDPKTFTRPWESKMTYELHKDWEILENIGYCEDRFLYNYKERILRGTVDWQSPEAAAGR